jgi:hypothetical protein
VIVVPLRTDDVMAGALSLCWTVEHANRLYEVDARMPASFAEQAALALQVRRSRDAEQWLVVFEGRDRIGRALHDLVIQRLFAVGLSLQSVSRISDVPQVTSRIDAAVDDLDATIKDIRRSIIAVGAIEVTADRQTELTKLVDRAAATMKFRPTLAIDGPVRTLVADDVAPHLLAVLGEALSNASRHANATSVALSAKRFMKVVCATPASGQRSSVAPARWSHLPARARLSAGPYPCGDVATGCSGALGVVGGPHGEPLSDVTRQFTSPLRGTFDLTVDEGTLDVLDQERFRSLDEGETEPLEQVPYPGARCLGQLPNLGDPGVEHGCQARVRRV